MAEAAPLIALLDAGLARGGLQSDDVLALVLPLLREVAALHELGQVAALDGVHAYRVVEAGADAPAPAIALTLPQGKAPTAAADAVARLQVPQASVLRVVGELQVTHDEDGGAEVRDLEVLAGADDAETIRRPLHVPGYTTWEQRVGHHDAITDVACLGQVLASLACGLDFCDVDDVRLFAANRGNLFRVQERLHPVIAGVIVEMTELDRRRRAQELPSLIRRLETYREQPRDLPLDASLARAARDAQGRDGAAGRRRAVHMHLRDRLFDLSRRNRLLHFRATQSTLNLTVASVPLVVDLKSIRLDQLCVWGGRFESDVLGGAKVALAQWLRFEDQPYLPASLDRVIQEARRDRAEFGMSQLSLVLAFLRWHNLKDDVDERIVSPLLLLPVEVTRRKGVRDQYAMQADTTEAAVNPVLRHQLRQVYGIELPEKLDLRGDAIAAFHAQLQASIAATEAGVRLRLLAEPEISLIHQRARQRLEQFRRRQRRRTPVRETSARPDFSYDADDFRPLGLRLFQERVLLAPLPVRGALGAAPKPRRMNIADTDAAVAPAGAAGNDAEAMSFSLREAQATGNPYEWELDLASVTLGNFNYRKMSLVRDYNALIANETPNPAVDRIFSLQPRELEAGVPALVPLAEQWSVVAADATQTAAVALAREGGSYIIQGPPGTGKSQTITNLIADTIGRGKRVLFVCEKRAAIDVVFHRLRQQGLDELCCMIHDSQADKKAFVLDLKQTYEHWLASADGLDELSAQRRAVVDGLAPHLQALERFDAAMRSVPPELGTTLRALVGRLVESAEHAAAAQRLDALQREALPTPATWQAHADLAERLQRTLADLGLAPVFAQHPFARLADTLVRDDRPLARLADACDRAETLADRCDDALQPLLAALPGIDPTATLDDAVALAAAARELQGLADHGLLALLDPRSARGVEFAAALADIDQRDRTLAAAAQKTTHWRERLPPAEALAALAQARTQERSPWRWLSPAWWRLDGTLKRCCDLSPFATRPLASALLAPLVAEQEAQAAAQATRARFAGAFGNDAPEALAHTLAGAREHAQARPAVAALQRGLLLATPEVARDTVAHLVALTPAVEGLATTCATLLRDAGTLPVALAGETVRDLREQADVLPDLLPSLLDLAQAHAAVAQAVRTLPLTAGALSHAIAREGLERLYRTERWLPRFDGGVLARHVQSLAAGQKQLLALNARTLRAAVRRRFLHNVQRSSLAAAQLDAEGKLFKKTYAAGRRELEHEFGKTMRFKAIRELASADSGRVVRDMKPIWLMSPLSVSDTLPLATDLFDVVIFDEASQIPVEEAVPALYRAPQAIVVGDEMQLPPTSFFSAARDADDDTVAVEDEGERIAVVLDADSLLNQGARNLPATLLAWHYRSRYESLIGFSNAAFYAGQLFTIPDRSVPGGDQQALHASGEGAAPQALVAAHVGALLARSISFHAIGHSPYESRRNEGEARYIAQLVRELLQRETGLSIGIVAFSEAQQSAIEAALDALGAEDPVFATRLEAETVREEDDQFCGLFVKNLENVQGDERDIILLSVCYGPNAQGRMAMNFGPINQRGGEKRLNVIFSRARRHMAVVSSIRHAAITNDYNEGAAALKAFLRYAECVSIGDRAMAQRVLEGLNPLARKALGGDGPGDAVAARIAAALRARGHVVDERIGQSRFRCDLGIRRATDSEAADAASHYALGLLVDTADHYANRDVFERYVSRPRILDAFGWHTVQVLARDWLHDAEGVLGAIERALRNALLPPRPEVTDEVAAIEVPAAASEFDEIAIDIEPPPPPIAVPAAGPALARGTPVRRLEFIDAASRKFWQVNREGCDVVVTFGRIGTQGQTQRKSFADEARATTEVDKLLAEKLRKGYVDAPAPA
jgi:predicted DNA-binding WGR domain protein